MNKEEQWDKFVEEIRARLNDQEDETKMDNEIIESLLQELYALKNAIRAKDFDLALQLVQNNDPPFLWTKDGHWLGGEETVAWEPGN